MYFQFHRENGPVKEEGDGYTVYYAFTYDEVEESVAIRVDDKGVDVIYDLAELDLIETRLDVLEPWCPKCQQVVDVWEDEDTPDMRCKKCGRTYDKFWSECPHCGGDLFPICPECGGDLSPKNKGPK